MNIFETLFFPASQMKGRSAGNILYGNGQLNAAKLHEL
jgi:hypothetical protein